jgi:hypothetical protein
MDIKDGGPAFPMPSGPEPRVNDTTHYNEGMSLRDYFAAAALNGLLASVTEREFQNIIGDAADRRGITVMQLEAGVAFEYADAMLKARATDVSEICDART